MINSESGGGAERSMNLLASSLVLRGVHVEIVAVNNGEADLFKPNCPIYSLNREWKGGIFSTISASIKLRKLVNHVRPDISILNCELPELLWLGVRKKEKFLIVEHTTRPWNNRRLLGFIARSILNFYAIGWVSVSRNGRIWPLNRVPIEVIPNPIQLPKSSKIEQLNFSSSAPKLVFIGRLNQVKQPELFLDICIATGREGILIGEGPLRNELEKKIADSTTDIRILGYKSDPWKYVSEEDIVIITSKIEGDGMVALEAIKKKAKLLLLDNPDLRRLGLPAANYAENIEDFKIRIQGHFNGTEKLDLSEEKSSEILAPREIEIITNSWLKLLDSV